MGGKHVLEIDCVMDNLTIHSVGHNIIPPSVQTLIGYSWKIPTKTLTCIKTMILTILVAIFGFNKWCTSAYSLALYASIILPSGIV